MKKYKEYRRTGDFKLKEVPSHWQLTVLKRATEFKYGDALQSETRDDNGDVNVYGSNGIVGKHNSAITQAPCIIIGRKGSYGKVNYSKEPCFPIDTAYFIDETVTNNDLRFIYYLVQTCELDTNSRDSAVPGLSREEAYNKKIALPPLPEQRAIAAYLDHKTDQLTTLLTQKEALLQLLHKKREAIINEAVTQGLDLAAPRKPSGVAWLGDVPAHWEVKKLKYLFKASLGGGTPDTTNDSFWNGDLPWVSPKDMKSSVISTTQDYVTELAIKSSSTSLIPENSVMVVVRSGILKHTFPVAVNAVPVTLNQDMKAFVPNNLITAEYLAHLLKGFQQHILNQCTKIGATVDSIETEWLYSFPFPVPPREEQERIVEYLHKSNTQINEAATAIHTQIKALKTYRQSLISEVVTGKVDVRAAESVAPEADLPLWRQLV